MSYEDLSDGGRALIDDAKQAVTEDASAWSALTAYVEALEVDNGDLRAKLMEIRELADNASVNAAEDATPDDLEIVRQNCDAISYMISNFALGDRE